MFPLLSSSSVTIPLRYPSRVVVEPFSGNVAEKDWVTPMPALTDVIPDAVDVEMPPRTWSAKPSMIATLIPFAQDPGFLAANVTSVMVLLS